MKVKIPAALIDSIIFKIDTDMRFTNINEKQKSKLTKRLIELWFFIYSKQVQDDDCLNLSFYVDIHSDELIKFDIMIAGLRLNYSKLFSLMSDLIECNGLFSSGNFSSGYRVNCQFLSGTKLTEIDLDLDRVFDKIHNKEYWIKKYPQFSHLIDDCYGVEINLDEYLNWLNQNKGIELTPKFSKKNGYIQERVLDDWRIYTHFFMALKVNLKNLFFKVSNQGRFYSSITNLPKTSIPFLKLWGERTISIDLKNCQPLLLSTMIDDSNFKEDCERGIFYEKIQNALSLGESASLKREMIKVMMYKLIFFGSKPLKSGKLYNAMERVYPCLISKINELKSNINLAHQLQKKESDIFVLGVGKLNIKKLIRHDEVLITHSNKIKVIKYLMNVLEAENIFIKYNF